MEDQNQQSSVGSVTAQNPAPVAINSTPPTTPSQKKPFGKKWIIIGGILIVVLLTGRAFVLSQQDTKTNVTVSPSPSISQPSPTAAESVNNTANGIVGRTMLGPTCPVINDDNAEECGDKPTQTTITVKSSDDSREITRFTSDLNGSFKISLPPGIYILTTSASTPPILKPVTIMVKKGEYTDHTLTLDSGMR